MAPDQQGKWGEPFDLSNVAVHVSLLPNGKVLYWGRRQDPKVKPISGEGGNMDEKFTKAFVWDPANPKNQSIATDNEPLDTNNKPVNLFCSGHAFLPDGTLLIAGGHIRDGQGTNQACIYDPVTNRFEAKVAMNAGRWYPSVITLPDGRALVASGSTVGYQVNNIPQIWPSDSGRANPSAWLEVSDPVTELGLAVGEVIPMYPRLHISPRGKVITVGPQAHSWYLNINDGKGVDIPTPVKNPRAGAGRNVVVGTWKDAQLERDAKYRDYCPSVAYAEGKIMYIGGGLTADQPGQDAIPTNEVEFLDLKNEATAKWIKEPNMNFKRRQFNATILPDGSVLVTGGTSGKTFNDLKSPVLTPELWSPESPKTWTKMADERFPRLYHSVALLLPSGKVLSAGGGEYQDSNVEAKDCLVTAQLYDPPYLCKGGPRPTILSTPAPPEIVYGQKFDIKIGTDTPGTPVPTLRNPNGVSWMRLGSVTHCRNMNQSLLFLDFTQEGTKVSISAPASSSLAPPGHYMLFVLDQRGVPSEARIMRIASPSAPKSSAPAAVATHTPTASVPATLHKLSSPMTSATPQIPPPTIQPTLAEHSARLMASQNRPPILVGLTPHCPYGLGPCWGGAFDALRRVNDVEIVAPVPSQEDSVAFVYTTKRDLLPDIDVWRKELAQTINGSYEMRGIEITVDGEVTTGKKGEMVVLTVAGGQEVKLGEFTQGSQIRWDAESKVAKLISGDEAGAYKRLVEALASRPVGAVVHAKVTGTLQKLAVGEFSLDVREFEVLDVVSSS